MTDLRLLACARTLQFNYGQGIWTPHENFRDLCRILKIVPTLDPIPDYKPLVYPFSFFGKSYPLGISGNFHLYRSIDEATKFLALAPAVKLNWHRNFMKAQELLFNFSYPELDIIFNQIISLKGNPNHGNPCLPFEISVEQV